MAYFKMRNVVVSLGKFLLSIVTEFRRLYWELIGKHKKKHKLWLTKEFQCKYGSYGDIAKILFLGQHLVRFEKSFEYETFKLAESCIKKGDIVFDIGANTGMFSVFYSNLVGETGRVYAFEPDKETFIHLKFNLELNRCNNVIILNKGLSDELGSGTMENDSFGNSEGDAFKYINVSSIESMDNENTIILSTIDEVVKEFEIDRINFIKIDVEGSELLVLRGGMESLRKLEPDNIIFEAYEPFCKRFEYRMSDLILFFDKLNYDTLSFEQFQWIATKSKTKI